MTLGTDQKRHMLTRFRKCYQHEFPRDVTVFIGDAMYDIHFKGEHVTTVQEYMDKVVLRRVKEVLEDPAKRVSHYYMLLDRGGTIAKKLFAHAKRNKGVQPIPEPRPGTFILPTAGLLPGEDRWAELIANREMARREVFPMYWWAVMERYTPPVGKCIIIDGAPSHQLSKEEYDATKDTAFSTVYFSRTLPSDPDRPMVMSSREMMSTPVPSGPKTIRGACPPELYLHNIQEGDLSAFFHVNKHIRHPNCAADVAPDQVILLDSNDSDAWLIALLHCRDRIDPNTFKFNSRVWVKLRGQKKTRDAYEKRKAAALKAKKEWKEDPIDGRDIYINVNMLYILMDRDPDLSKAQYPQGMAVFLYILSGTDFFGDYIRDDYAFAFNMNWEKHIWDTWCKHAERFANMVLLFYTGPLTYNQPELLRRPFFDEEAILTFFYQCYASKWGKQIKEINGVRQITVPMLEEYLRASLRTINRKPGEDDEKYAKRLKRAKKSCLPPRAVFVRWIRIAYLNFVYWINDYRPGGPEMLDPLEIYQGFPYYGFMIDPKDPEKKRITLSPVCSAAKPVPDFYVPHTGKHRRVTKKQPPREEDQPQDDDNRDAERETRRKKIAEKETRRRAKEAEEEGTDITAAIATTRKKKLVAPKKAVKQEPVA